MRGSAALATDPGTTWVLPSDRADLGRQVVDEVHLRQDAEQALVVVDDQRRPGPRAKSSGSAPASSSSVHRAHVAEHDLGDRARAGWRGPRRASPSRSDSVTMPTRRPSSTTGSWLTPRSFMRHDGVGHRVGARRRDELAPRQAAQQSPTVLGLPAALGEAVLAHPLVVDELGHVVADRVGQDRRRCACPGPCACATCSAAHTAGAAAAAAQQALLADQPARHQERLAVLGLDPLVDQARGRARRG